MAIPREKTIMVVLTQIRFILRGFFIGLSALRAVLPEKLPLGNGFGSTRTALKVWKN